MQNKCHRIGRTSMHQLLHRRCCWTCLPKILQQVVGPPPILWWKNLELGIEYSASNWKVSQKRKGEEAGLCLSVQEMRGSSKATCLSLRNVQAYVCIFHVSLQMYITGWKTWHWLRRCWWLWGAAGSLTCKTSIHKTTWRKSWRISTRYRRRKTLFLTYKESKLKS